jgi:hypothetical protein
MLPRSGLKPAGGREMSFTLLFSFANLFKRFVEAGLFQNLF